ncbi:MAG: UDP-2,3-diacylglucosamine diphosphatase [Sulfurovaceae bacterium]|nr:UDP-2,3-diacylglucosamine diphosphatase [Sulfurovaceae bacterium]MDD5548098.1 UDP-2,3-diacylglucosamine diphosphatase [Sulfurovaceae bacterium]
MQYKSIFISDIHLGTRFAKAEEFLNFLKYTDSENLFFVGDIIDGWAIKRKMRWFQSHSDVIQKVLKKSRKGTQVYFITGNHDEFLRPFAPLFLGDNIHIVNEASYTGTNGKKYLVTHGDFFDSITMTHRWLALAGDIGYDFALYLNHIFNKFRNVLGIKKYWSFSKYIKDNVKSSVSFINNFEEILASHAKHKKYDGVICGHIHKPEFKEINNVLYYNCGDWVENCSAVVEHFDGRFEIIRWEEK